MIKDLAPAGYLERKIGFDVLVTEWGDVFFSEAHIPLGARPRPHDFRIPFTLYSRVTRRALHDCDEGDRQYEVRGGRIYDYNGNLMVDPPAPRRPRSRDRRRDVDLEALARIYNDAERAPTKTVAREMHLSERTAARRVADARAAGLIDEYGRP
jgi:hypothetical protein